jgi:hypothetical protein
MLFLIFTFYLNVKGKILIISPSDPGRGINLQAYSQPTSVSADQVKSLKRDLSIDTVPLFFFSLDNAFFIKGEASIHF